MPRSIFYRDIKRNRGLYLMIIPVLVFYIYFHYKPMYGALIAFKDYIPMKGIMGSPWAGFKHFENFFGSHYFKRVVTNTFLISLYNLIFGFPAPILLALLLNEVRKNWFKRMVQTASYLPHFVSMVVICGIIKNFMSTDGIINDLAILIGREKVSYLLLPEYFRTIYIASGIWQEAGWGSIIYLAALTAIDPQLYEASMMDGAGRFRQVWYITMPGIMPTIIIMLILRIGQMMNVGFEKIILLYNPTTYVTADVISSFVYRKGLQEFNYSYSAAVGLFNSFINCTLLVLANWFSKKINETSLW
jgi:putative aldouronate transport system permease protein